MNTSRKNTSLKRTNSGPRWYRRVHRWMGVTLAVFVLILSITGIALNHATDFGLDRRYIGWSWLLDAYGLAMPEPAASFEDEGHRATLIGERLYFNGVDIDQETSALTGIAVVGPLALVTGLERAQLLTTEGGLVETLDLGGELPGTIERAGRADGRIVIESAGALFISDPDIAAFEPLDRGAVAEIAWPAASQPDFTELQALEVAWRGRGLTVERVLLDLHSGRLFALPGRVVLDFVGIGLILLSITGLVLWRRRNRPNGAGRRNGGSG